MRAFHARQFELEFFEFKETLDLEVLGVDETLTLSVTDLHVIEQVCDDALELRVRNLEHRSVFKQRKCRVRLEDILDDVDYTLHPDANL